MTTLDAMTEALVATLRNVPKLNAGYVAGSIVPYAEVGLPPIEYRGTFGANGQWGPLEFPVTVLIGGQVTDDTMRTLRQYMEVSGDKSIMAAIESDRTLGGVVEDCVVTAVRPLDFQEVQGFGSMGAEFTIRVVARRG